MEKVSISKLIDFRNIEKQGPKLTFIRNLQKPKIENKGSGGDYWICGTSASAAAFWNNDQTYLDDKIHELKEKIEATEYKRTKDQFQKNIDIMVAMHEFDFDGISPGTELKKQTLKQNIVKFDTLPIQVRPQHIFSYEIDEKPNVGAVWLVAKKDGYKTSELGMFATALYHCLKNGFSDNFAIDPDFCIAIDISTTKEVRYSNILKEEVPDILKSTVSELLKLL
jgi:hypothetical protein